MAQTTFARASLAAALAGTIAASACIDIVATDASRYVDREERRFDVTGPPEVTLSTFAGSIEVRPWDRQEVLVVVEKYAMSKEAAADIEVKAEQRGNRVTIEAQLRPADRHFGFNNRRSARLIVSVPASSDVIATSGDGSIDVERVAGRMELRTGDGSIRGRDLSGDVRAQTGDGSIRFEDVGGSLDIGTGDGSIIASGALSTVRARSGDGSVSIRAESGSTVRDDWNISTGDGSVTLELPDVFDAELDVHTGDGTVSVRDGALSNTLEHTKRSVRGRLGAGGRSVRVRTGDGSITLRRS